MALRSCEMGMEEMTWLAGYSVVVPSLRRATTLVARPLACLMPETRVLISILQPILTTRSRQRSHIMPGPNLGYWNSSMREVMFFWLRLGSSAFITALESERFLMRCAAKSEGSLLTGTPQSFSL